MAAPPPSYESVIADINRQIQTGATPLQMLRDVKLSIDQMSTLAANKDKLKVDITDEKQKQIFTMAASKTLTSAEVLNAMGVSADAAAKAAQDCDASFVRLLLKLQDIDNMGKPPAKGAFQPRFRKLYETFQEQVERSRSLANNIGVYGEQFDGLICKMMCDQNLTVQQRQEAIMKWHKNINDYDVAAKALSRDFEQMQTSVREFINEFKDWATDKLKEDGDRIRTLKIEIDKIKDQIENLKSAMFGAGVGAGISLLVGAGLAWVPVVGPAILVGGLIGAGVGTAGAVGMAIAIAVLQGKRNDKQDEIDRLTKEIAEINNAKEKLVTLGATELNSFESNLKLLAVMWSQIQKTCEEVESWLKTGADFANMPEYLKMSMDESCKIYKPMGQLMKAYARQIPAK